VYLLAAVHILHWKATGKTLSPVEPSEAMQTLELGYVNAGLIFFALAILSTLIFGRFFCGWGCHIVALQDLCGWALKKIGLKPKPFRSRLLVFVPLIAALYMFVYPTAVRLFEGRGLPEYQNHLMTSDFWQTFPTAGISILTFVVCGFIAVVLLGNKGFCTYGCPYGAVFFHADRLSPGKIRVTDACEHCGHCTASCTSNVRVHDEVRRFGMVVDAGCMKCLDCISVCPKGALYFGFGKTSLYKEKASLLRTPTLPPPAKKYDFSWLEEIFMALVFIASLFVYRNLYNAIPFLLTLGLSGLTAFVLVQAAKLLYSPNVRVQHLQLRKQRTYTAAGVAALLVSLMVGVFLVHSGVWQYHYRMGVGSYKVAERSASSDGDATAASMDALHHLSWCSRNGLFPVADVEARIGTARAFSGDLTGAIPPLRRSIVLAELPGVRYQLARTFAALRRNDEAFEELSKAYEHDAKFPGVARDYAVALAARNDNDNAVGAFRIALEANPNDAGARNAFGITLARTGKLVEAEAEVRKSIAIEPGAPQAWLNLALILAESNQTKAALAAAAKASRLAPSTAEPYVVMGALKSKLADANGARAAFAAAISAEPFNLRALRAWADLEVTTGRAAATAKRLAVNALDNAGEGYKLAVLYRAMGQTASADTVFRRLEMVKPGLERP
jgi:polyferredoxin/Flp pilus assembly protein TadD